MRTTVGLLALGLVLGGCNETPKQEAVAATASAAAATASAQITSAAPSATAAASASAADSSAPAPSASSPASDPSVASSAKGAPVASPSASSAKGDTGEVKGEENKGAAFSAFMTASKSYKAGQQGTVTAVVTALGDYHVNPEFPYKVKLAAAPAGVTFPSDTIKDVSRSEKRATMSIPFTASQPGPAVISGTISLSVCTKDQCVIEKAPVSVTVKVD